MPVIPYTTYLSVSRADRRYLLMRSSFWEKTRMLGGFFTLGEELAILAKWSKFREDRKVGMRFRLQQIGL